MLPWFARRPFQAVARAFQLLVVQRRKYARPGGYDAEHYWRDRLAQHGLALRGPGKEGRSEAENLADYSEAAERFREFCCEEGLDLRRAGVLEIGCGTGFYATLCRDEGVRAYMGVDITDVLFPRLVREFPAYEFLRRDVTSDHLDGVFDVVLMIDVVEHIVTERQLDVAMQNVQRCLAPGGTFVLAFPLPGHWPRRLFYLRRWREVDITRLFDGYAIGRPQPFRDGSILALRKPKV
jgi:SAM-dependent methyltransferase